MYPYVHLPVCPSFVLPSHWGVGDRFARCSLSVFVGACVRAFVRCSSVRPFVDAFCSLALPSLVHSSLPPSLPSSAALCFLFLVYFCCPRGAQPRHAAKFCVVFDSPLQTATREDDARKECVHFFFAPSSSLSRTIDRPTDRLWAWVRSAGRPRWRAPALVSTARKHQTHSLPVVGGRAGDETARDGRTPRRHDGVGRERRPPFPAFGVVVATDFFFLFSSRH